MFIVLCISKYIHVWSVRMVKRTCFVVNCRVKKRIIIGSSISHNCFCVFIALSLLRIPCTVVKQL